MKTFAFVVTVSGSLPFPVDMLRYDRCTPNTEQDSNRILSSFDPMSGRVKLDVIRAGCPKTWSPTAARWKSFGWDVMEVRRIDP